MSSDAGLTPFGNALAGAFGAVFANATTFPLDTVKTRIQAEEKQAKAEASEALPSPQIKRINAPGRLPPRKASARAVARRIMKEKGIEGFYRGFAASMLNTFSMQLCVLLASIVAIQDVGLTSRDAAPTFTGTRSYERRTSNDCMQPCPALRGLPIHDLALRASSSP